ncbi:MAG: hypothetical protein J6T10_25935 [Methanobrevibacter sp.]|nr:hypothetical protein [Methanobrevibacter sp.]
MIDINKSEKMDFLNTKIYVTKGDFEIKTGQFYDVVNGKILLEPLSPILDYKYKIPTQTTLKNDFDLEFYFMPYEKRKRIAAMMNIEPLGWSHEGIEYIDIHYLFKVLKDFINDSSKADEIFLRQIFNKL